MTKSIEIRDAHEHNLHNMPLLDTNDWNLVLGLEYTLIGRGMLLDVGYDFNIEGEELSSDFLLWFEKDWYRFEKQRIGTVAWAFYRTSGPMSFAFYASWHRTAAEGLNGTVYLGAKFEADSAFDYVALDQSINAYNQAYEEYYQSKEIYEWSGGTTELLEEPSLESLVFRQTLGSWLGPVFRPRISYLALWERTTREFKILSVIDSSDKVTPLYSTALFYLARAMLSENEHAKVMRLLDESIRLDPANYFSYNLKALILGGQGDIDGAKKIYAYIVTREPKFASAYVNLGNLYWNARDYESAWDIWSMGHEALPQDPVLAKWTRVAEDSLKAMVYSGKL